MTRGVDGTLPADVVPLWPDGPPPSRRRARSAQVAVEASIEALGRGLWSAETLGRGIVEASQDCVEVLDLQGNLQFTNPTARRLLRHGDVRAGEGEPWLASWRPEARVAISTALATVQGGGTARFSEWRPTAEGEMRFWEVVISRMVDGRGGLVGLLAASHDITALRQSEDGHDLRSRELSHRLRNIFALVNGLVTLSARDVPAVQPYARTLRDRFTALGRALDYLHAAPTQSDAAHRVQTLQGLMRTLLQPYDDPGSAELRFRFVDAEDDAPIGDAAVTGLALTVHELATNAVKHGALSNAMGRVCIGWRREGEAMRLTWTERGGPPIAGLPERVGFGSTLTQRSVGGQLGGTISHHWAPEGLTVLISLPLRNLAV